MSHLVSDQYVTAYINAWHEWKNLPFKTFFLDWLIEEYGVKYLLDDHQLRSVKVVNDEKHFLFLIKHSS